MGFERYLAPHHHPILAANSANRAIRLVCGGNLNPNQKTSSSPQTRTDAEFPDFARPPHLVTAKHLGVTGGDRLAIISAHRVNSLVSLPPPQTPLGEKL